MQSESEPGWRSAWELVTAWARVEVQAQVTVRVEVQAQVTARVEVGVPVTVPVPVQERALVTARARASPRLRRR